MKEMKTILLIDDDYDMHVLCKKYLTSNGFTFISAFNGQEGIELLSKHKIDMILLDFMMPEMDGFQFYKKLTSEDRFKKYKAIPVIMLTVMSEERIKSEELFDMGLALLLQKPFNFNELIEVIKNVFNLMNKKNEHLTQLATKLPIVKHQVSEHQKFKSQIQRKKELQNSTNDSNPIDNELIPGMLIANLPLKEARKKWIEKYEKRYLIHLLSECNGNISRAAKVAQVNRMTIYRMIGKYNISLNKSN